MPLIYVILILAVVGLGIWALLKYVPMPDIYKKIIIAVTALTTIIWLLKVFGVWEYIFAVEV